jgi:hypothetical protein
MKPPINSLIQAWLDAQQASEEAAQRELQAYADADLAALPAKLRPATPKDIVEGAILWYPHWSEKKWSMVVDVRYPDDQWKAYCADDGCRYGLDGAFVEVAP